VGVARFYFASGAMQGSISAKTPAIRYGFQ
jgi:hypothetical protein